MINLHRICPLCLSESISGETIGPLKQPVFQCGNCQLAYTNPDFYPDYESERERYSQHNNKPEDERYRTFLNRAVLPALPYLTSGMKALDYGCGPGPTIQFLLEESHISCMNYDPIFYPDFPQTTFDVIFATECVEHFHQPAIDFQKIYSLLKTNGILTIMTHPYQKLEEFPNWYYAKDPTHVVFYHQKTFAFIESKFGLKMLATPEERVYVFRKTG